MESPRRRKAAKAELVPIKARAPGVVAIRIPQRSRHLFTRTLLWSRTRPVVQGDNPTGIEWTTEYAAQLWCGVGRVVVPLPLGPDEWQINC